MAGEKMDQSASSISNSSPLSLDDDKMFRNGKIFKSAGYLPFVKSFKSFKCSYLLTVLLFKCTAGCNNVCPGNSSCNKKYLLDQKNSANATFLTNSYQSNGVILPDGVSLHNQPDNSTLHPALAIIPYLSVLLNGHENLTIDELAGHRNYSKLEIVTEDLLTSDKQSEHFPAVHKNQEHLVHAISETHQQNTPQLKLDKPEKIILHSTFEKQPIRNPSFPNPQDHLVHSQFGQQNHRSFSTDIVKLEDSTVKVLQETTASPKNFKRAALHQMSLKKAITMADGPFSQNDPSSFSEPETAAIEHIDLFLDVNFESKILSGEAHYTVKMKKPNATSILMDVHNLTISEILEKESKEPLSFKIGDHVENFGSKLDISVPPSAEPNHRVQLIIRYQTSPTSSALQWLEPAQTAGGKHPYLFSQCQPIHCRSMLPVQDTPSVKQTYTATITKPKGLTVLMSALRTEEHENYFYQPIKVPSYLIAIVVGNLAEVKLSERSSVWSEPELVKEAADEFNETEMFLETAESICGSYVWKVYDLVMLPPSFPFGGMENPCLTFLTPTLLAGDRSLAMVVAHEIAHSWTGNLVTNRDFQHFWLNEGFTMFVERKIMGRLRGEAERHFDALGGLKDLKQALKTLGETNPLTKLIVDLKHTHPDDAFSTCPYEKGHTFLFYLEELLGGPTEFEPWLKSYLNAFALQSISTDQFKAHLTAHFRHKPQELSRIDWDLWLHTTGMPPHIPKYDTSLQDACNSLAQRWLTWNTTTTSSPAPFSPADLQPFTAGQKIEFLAILLDRDLAELSKVRALQDAYDLNSVRNCEIRFRWLKLCLKARWQDQVPLVLDMVTTQGRMKYVRPLYRELYAWEHTRQTAIDTFLAHRKNMMHVTAYTVAKDLKLEPEPATVTP